MPNNGNTNKQTKTMITTTYKDLATLTKAVDNGETVHWKSTIYRVVHSYEDQYLVMCSLNDHCVGLTSLDGILQGNIEDFFTPTNKLNQ